MNETDTIPGLNEQPKTHEIIQSLWKQLPQLASHLIESSQDLSNPLNRHFCEFPDDPEAHSPEWHQWGIITHSQMVEKAFIEEVPKYLNEWGLKDRVDQKLAEEVDGMPKSQLLLISVPLHDLGKFTSRQLKQRPDGSVSPSSKGHEAASGQIVRSPGFSQMLKTNYGLTDNQVEYLARCAELHFELGILRNAAKQSPGGYKIEFTQGEVFRGQARQLLQQYPDFQLEMGLFYLTDSLGKTEFCLGAKTDEEIAQQSEKADELVKTHGLNPELAGAVRQLDVNIAAARAYLQIWAETPLNN